MVGEEKANTIRVDCGPRGPTKRFHQDMQSAGICNVGLGLPDSKMPATHQICITISIMTSNNPVLSLLARLKSQNTQSSFFRPYGPFSS